MNTSVKTLLISSCALILTTISSCNEERDNTYEDTINKTTTADDTAKVVETGQTAEEQLEDFRTWLNKQAEKGDTAIKREWPRIKDELRRRNQKLERNFDSLSDKSQEEYRQLQDRFERWENRQERRQQQPLDTNKLSDLAKQLLQEHRFISQIEPTNYREAYLTFMGGVRAKRKNWTLDDWDYVDNIYSQLNQRYRQLENELSTSDKIKIRTLQAEYLALEGSADTQNMMRGISKEK